MHPFSYSSVNDAAAAVREQATHSHSTFIAGGTNLLDLMKENVARPAHLIGLNQLPLAFVEDTPEGGLRLGALATNANTAYHPEVEKRYPLLSQAILSGATAQLRNMATNGGNLMQRTRCYYFYDLTTPCNKREPGSGCSALGGFNRIHAILGASEQCIATHPSDMCVALTALDALVCVQGPQGERVLPFADFHRLPGSTPHQDNNLKPGELITALELPKQGFAQHYHYLKIRDRASYAFALVSIAAVLELDGDTITEARVALGGVAHKPWRERAAEELLIGQPTTEATFTKAASYLLRGARGYGHNDFKIELAKRGIVRALQQAAAEPRGPRALPWA
ncbi:xanthine dehydrogenase family protein subunit M [Hymenobacter sp. YC55]|uniref:FAD binding domain-containing protein n=1 Tax=Hymenobacter sp. YC55 TaxID=3034019 RepID=UPI0023F9FEDB|nr:xanthine dehydrogenase family protein subunit M [Hymenobacter sp. YC55]MDF7815876.1 xanthine dehydrogenase family protein subunit M [Hymenobacter sp. YC55]